MTESNYINRTIREALQPFVDMIDNPELYKTCELLWLDERFQALDLSPAALTWHHNYEGGLLAHTAEVASFAEHAANVDRIARVNYDVLMAAALWHDVAKIHEYECRMDVREKLPAKHLEIREEPDGMVRYWVTSQYYRRIYHISGSAMEFHHNAMKNGVDFETAAKVEHCILAHHGPVKDWGSPVEPQSIEALILHHADMLSSKFGPAMRKP